MPHESPAVDAVTRLAELPGIPEQVEAAREACTRLRWHQALRRRIPEAAAESRVRGAAASGELEGATVPVDVLRDIVRGAVTWSPSPDPVEVTMRGVLAATAETERMVLGVTESPKPPPVRITLTLPAVARSREVWLVVSGSEKAEAVAKAIGGASPDEVPAAGAVGRDATVWLLDEAAAANL